VLLPGAVEAKAAGRSARTVQSRWGATLVSRRGCLPECMGTQWYQQPLPADSRRSARSTL